MASYLLYNGTRPGMNKLLVPIENFSGLSLTATYFALGFAKRNPAKIFFLIFSPSSQEGALSSPSPGRDDLQRLKFEDLIQKARAEKINLEIFYSTEDLVEVTRQFSRDHNMTEIIIALPPEHDPVYPKLVEQIGLLRNGLESQLIIVKSKEEKMAPRNGSKAQGDQPRTQKIKPAAGRKG
jgi:hypothetical protein